MPALAATYGAAGLPGPGESLIPFLALGISGGWAKERHIARSMGADPYVSPEPSAFSLSSSPLIYGLASNLAETN
jgi:hypothetical protein